LKYKGDAIALLEPRPDRIEPVSVFVGTPGFSSFQSIGTANNTINMTPNQLNKALFMTIKISPVFGGDHMTYDELVTNIRNYTR
jgi:hypothetical protein